MKKFSEENYVRQAAWLGLVFACFHAAFLLPSGNMILGLRPKFASAVIFSIALVLALLSNKGKTRICGVNELIISILLGVWPIISGLLSETPFAATIRGYTISAPCVCGFWLARSMIVSEKEKERFRDILGVILAALLIVSYASELFAGSVFKYADVNPHPLAGRILLMWLAPLSLILSGAYKKKVFGWALLLASYGIFYFTDLRSAFLIPVALLAIAGIMKLIRPLFLISIVVFMTVATTIFINQLPGWKLSIQAESAYWRAESYPFSIHIALKNPIFGVGPRAPRDQYLEDYQIRYPFVTKEKVEESVKRVVTSENIFLTFMADLGFPFVTIYCGVLIVLLLRLITEIRSARGPTSAIPPMALFLSISAGIIHFMIYDGLYHPQVSLFFHLWLGLIPHRDDKGP